MLNKLMQLQKGETGFTVIETMIILTVILILLSVAVLPFPKLAANVEKRQFLNQLQADIFLAQSYAVAKQEKVELRFSSANNSYTVKPFGAAADVIVQRHLPDLVQYTEGSLSKVSFLPNGNTDSFGTVHFNCGDRRVSLIFQIGKGRFYVKEE